MGSHAVSLLRVNDENNMSALYQLKGSVKHYDWGGVSLIPALLQLENKENRPFAEYWMGTHPGGKAELQTGEDIVNLTGYLPYLIKVLDVKNMLSIQVHPSKEAATREFARENEAGIPLNSPERNYKDDNHKPELMVALSEFWLLHGFKPAEELVYTLLNVVELRELLQVFNAAGYGGLYKHVMEMPQPEVNRILQPLIDNISFTYKDSEPDKYDEDFWVAKAAQSFTVNGNLDRGIFSIYLFNLVHLKKGEGIFQAAGVPHAYLEGQNVEIMASSDNVLRGGLTSKHIDVKELMKHVRFEATHPAIISPTPINSDESIYTVPVQDFALSVLELGMDQVTRFSTAVPEILLLTDGAVAVSSNGTSIELRPGLPSALLMPGNTVMVKGLRKATVFRASLPVNSR